MQKTSLKQSKTLSFLKDLSYTLEKKESLFPNDNYNKDNLTQNEHNRNAGRIKKLKLELHDLD